MLVMKKMYKKLLFIQTFLLPDCVKVHNLKFTQNIAAHKNIFDGYQLM